MFIGLGLPITRSGGAGVAPFVGILDQLSTAPIGAWSVARRLRVGYESALIRVRRSSDNAELDIGYDADNALDTVALLAHCGAGNGFVVKIYDQSGQGRHLVQSTAGAQPKIVTSGAVETENGLPCAVFNASGAYMVTAAFSAITGTTIYAASVFTHDGTASQGRTFGGQADNVSQNDGNSAQSFGAAKQIFGGGAYAAYRNGVEQSGGATSMTALIVASCRWDGTDERIAYNNGALSSGTASTGSFNVEKFMLNTEYAFGGFTGVVGARHCEHMAFSTIPSSGDQTTLKAEQVTFYGI